ncbi:MAG: hypothetical protein KDC79_01885 [Cyclobacteriaceae bacterium]|nr:hypothetical protein [Cyclobacteriaceae bacterium]
MRALKIFLLLALSLSVSYSYAQKEYKKSLTQKYGQKKKPLRFKSSKKMAVICPVFHPSEYPYQGIGFRAGDPFALTYKLYATPWISFSIDGGIAAYGLYKDRYKELYLNSPGADTLVYFNHQVEKDLFFSGKVSFYHEGPKFLKGLDIYAGFGWQLRYAQVLYGYNHELNPQVTEFGTTTVQYDYMGPEFHIGLEYAYFDLPISAFIETNVFYDVIQSPQFVKFQGGIGLRFVF